jgi:hypothetical protein
MAGNFYFNAHSKENPGGFARWQMVLPTAPAPVFAAVPAVSAPAPTAAGTSVRPPSTGDAGLADSGTLLPLAGLLALTISGAGVFALARRRA